MAAVVRINLLMQDDEPINTCSESPVAVTLQFMDTRGRSWADNQHDGFEYNKYIQYMLIYIYALH